MSNTDKCLAEGQLSLLEIIYKEMCNGSIFINLVQSMLTLRHWYERKNNSRDSYESCSRCCSVLFDQFRLVV